MARKGVQAASRNNKQQQQLEGLESRLYAGFWNPATSGNPYLSSNMRGLPPKPEPKQQPRNNSRVRLSPLPDGSPTLSSPSKSWEARGGSPSPSSSIARAPRGGHMGAMRAMCRSTPAMPRRLEALDRSSLRSSEATQQRRTPPLRTRPLRRPADYGLGIRSSGRDEEGGMRCESVPPTGTPKADEEAALRMKANAIATLQRLFFEELATEGQDANGAAARALLRLQEATAQASDEADGQPSESVDALPLHPSPAIGRSRRPCSRVSVHA
jgi:hypothetical protein